MLPLLLQVIVFLFISIQALPLEPRLTLADGWNSYYQSDTNGPGTYTFGYDLEDPDSGNVQYRVEERYPNGTVIGSYGVLESDGNVKVVKYIADDFGYRVTVEDSAKKNPRYHPPLTSRSEEQRGAVEAAQSPPLRQGMRQTFGAFTQSIQEIRTPPKHQEIYQDLNF